MAPIMVLAFCCGGEDPFLNVIERSIDRSHVAFLGSTHEDDYNDVERIYPPLLASLAELGSNPELGHRLRPARIDRAGHRSGLATRTAARRNDPL